MDRSRNSSWLEFRVPLFCATNGRNKFIYLEKENNIYDFPLFRWNSSLTPLFLLSKKIITMKSSILTSHRYHWNQSLCDQRSRSAYAQKLLWIKAESCKSQRNMHPVVGILNIIFIHTLRDQDENRFWDLLLAK